MTTERRRDELARRLLNHQAWLSTNGRGGERLDLKAACLGGLDWSDISLVEVELRQALLEGGRFIRADLYGSTLAGACLDRAELSGANLSKANSDEASLVECGCAEPRRSERPSRGQTSVVLTSRQRTS